MNDKPHNKIHKVTENQTKKEKKMHFEYGDTTMDMK